VAGFRLVASCRLSGLMICNSLLLQKRGGAKGVVAGFKLPVISIRFQAQGFYVLGFR